MNIEKVLISALLLLLCFSKSSAARLREVHAFMYLWYGADGEHYTHWNHAVLPHWEESVSARFPTIGTRFRPPDNLHSPYYPVNGPYSSANPATVQRQLADMTRAGIDVAVLSWWGPGRGDTQGISTDATLAALLPLFDAHGGIRVAIHLEPYDGRSVASVRADLKYLVETYGHHSCLLTGRGRMTVYVYDSHHLPPHEWAQLLLPTGDDTIRNTPLDCEIFGLWLHHHHGRDLSDAGFDGVYSYFASVGFSYGSTPDNWRGMCSFARQRGLACSLSVGPGYNDSLIRPWNSHNEKARQGGRYYDAMWAEALRAGPEVVSITSWNEWGEGTQIEPARAWSVGQGEKRGGVDSSSSSSSSSARRYEGYGEGPDEDDDEASQYLYVDRTMQWKRKMLERGAAPGAEL